MTALVDWLRRTARLSRMRARWERAARVETYLAIADVLEREATRPVTQRMSAVAALEECAAALRLHASEVAGKASPRG